MPERNPCGQLPARKGGDSDQTAGVKPEEGEGRRQVIMALMPRGCTRATMGWTERCQVARPRPNRKNRPSVRIVGCNSPAWKPESLVIADQHCTAVNVFLSLVHTARQATKAGGIRSRRSRKAGAEDETRDGD